MENKTKILIVDDEEINRGLFEAMTASLGYESVLAANGKEALEKINSDFDLVLMDVMMPLMDGFRATRKIRENPETSDIPVIIITALGDKEDRLNAVKAGANDFITKPVEKLELQVRTKSLLDMKMARDSLKNYNARLEEEVIRRTKDLRNALEEVTQANLDTIERLVRAAQRKDDATGSHITRMSSYVFVLARSMGYSEKESNILRVASTMHDIGKIGTPDQILLKPGKLSAREWEIMKDHTLIGAEILRGSHSEYLKMGETIALTHHEKWNGQGYPQGLEKEDIPMAGRICAVADVFDALTTDRPYRPAMDNESSLKIMRDWSGENFDPVVLDKFFENLDEILAIKGQYQD